MNIVCCVLAGSMQRMFFLVHMEVDDAEHTVLLLLQTDDGWLCRGKTLARFTQLSRKRKDFLQLTNLSHDDCH